MVMEEFESSKRNFVLFIVDNTIRVKKNFHHDHRLLRAKHAIVLGPKFHQGQKKLFSCIRLLLID